jgi:hypothetical protein
MRQNRRVTPTPGRAPAAAARWPRLLVPLALLAAQAAMLGGRLDSTVHQHGDEGWWIAAGKVSYDLAFRHREPFHPAWQARFGNWGSPNPQLGKYLIGASVSRFAGLPPVPLESADGSRRLAPHRLFVLASRQAGIRRAYDFTLSREENRAAGQAPPPRILAAARRGVLATALLAAALLWWAAREVAGEAAAALALAGWILHPALADHSVRAMIDVPALAGVLLGLAGAVAVACRDELSRTAAVAIGLSALGFGLAVATKLNALAPWAGALLAALAWVAVSGRLPRRRRLAAVWALALVVVPPAISFASNPFLWTRTWEPIHGQPNRPAVLLSLAGTVARLQHPDRLESLPGRLAATARFLTGRDLGAAGRIGGALGGVLALVGVAAAARALRARGAGEPRARGALAFAAISGVTWAATVAWLPLPWDRYLLPLLPAYLVAAASGAVAVARAATALARRGPTGAAA